MDPYTAPVGDRDHGPTVAIAAFDGWTDAADAASDVVEHLALTWDGDEVAVIDDERYFDYQQTRPTITLTDGVLRRVRWPAVQIVRCRPPGAAREVLIVHGPEPSLYWRGFAAELLDRLVELGAETIVTVGALLADTAHTRPVDVTGSAFTAEAARRFGLSPSNYDGPTGMTGVLQDACVRAGVPAVSLWGAVPHYFAQSPSPKVMLALLRALQDVTGVAMPVGDLPARAAEWERTIDELTAADEDIGDYIRSLEERGDDDTAAAVDAMDGAELAEEFERFLRRRGDDGPGDGAPGPDRSDEQHPE